MDRRELEVFVTVMQLGSVSAAARTLDMAQPSVSKAIAQIERRHGISLFERYKGRLRPTEAAQQLIGEAQRLDGELSRFDRYVDSVRKMQPGLIRIAATPSLSLGTLPLLAKAFREIHGGQGFILDMHPNHDIIAAVERRQYDVGFLVHAGTDTPATTLPIARGRIVCVFSEDDELQKQDEVMAEDVLHDDLIAISTDMAIVAMLNRAVPGYERGSSRRLETNRYNIAVNLVRQGLGRTLIDEFTMGGVNTEGICWRPLAPRLDVTLLAAVADNTSMRSEIRDLLDIARKVDFSSHGN